MGGSSRVVCFAACVLIASCDASAAPGIDSGTTPRVDASSSDTGPRADTGPLPDTGPLGPDDLPQGDMGIAARHPGDVGIDGDSEVIFADDFEGYADASGLDARWNAGVYHDVTFTTDPAIVHRGGHSLDFTAPMMDAEWSNTVARTVSPELDVLFLRFYSRYDPAFDVVGSSHNGGGISAHYFIDGMATPGVPADGTNKFLVEYEAWRGEVTDPSPGTLNIYAYHPEQRSMWGDHFFPDGTVSPYSPTAFDFGPAFVSRPQITPELGRWYCYEVMLRANTVGMRDGRVALWLDGALIADFRNLRFRDVDTLTIDRFNLSFHTHANPAGVSHKWYDDVVAARSYIGPIFGG